MNGIKKIPKKDMGAFAEIVAGAYPGILSGAKDEVALIRKRLLAVAADDPTLSFHGYYRKGKLLGGLRLHDFNINFHSTFCPMGGGGLLAVDLAHKKERVAYDLMHYFLRHYREQGTCLTALYPFRPDFYVRMGFGYGTKTTEYRIKPGDLPHGSSKEHLRYLTKSNARQIEACYNRVYKRTHGMMKRCRYEMRRLSRIGLKTIGYVVRGRVEGFISFEFKKAGTGNFVLNDLHIIDMIYEHPAAFGEMMTFLYTQFDQVRHIVYSTQDDDFHFVPVDPRNHTDNMLYPEGTVYHECGKSAVGVMYRVVDVPGVFAALRDHNFGGQSCRVKLTVRDTFLPENDGSHVIDFKNGAVRSMKKSGKADFEISLDIADFSSVIIGSVDLLNLYRYGRVKLSDDRYLDAAGRLFYAREKPRCTTQF